MKNIIFLTVMLTAWCITASAAVTPIDRGSVILGGSIYYKYYENHSNDSYSSRNFMLTTSLGFFPIPGFMVGADIDVALSGGEAVFGLGPAIGYYVNTNPRRPDIRGSVFLYFRVLLRYVKAYAGSDYELCPGAAIGIDRMILNVLAVDIGILVLSEKIYARWHSSSRTMTMRVGAGIAIFIY